MPNITLLNGNKLNFQKKVTGMEVAEKIGKSIAKQALIMSVDGELKDLTYTIEKDCSIKIITAKDNFYKVFVGPFKEEETAKNIANELLELGYNSIYMEE